MSKDKTVLPVELTIKSKFYIKEEDIEEIIIGYQGDYERYIETMITPDVSGFDNYDYEKRDIEEAIALYIKSNNTLNLSSVKMFNPSIKNFLIATQVKEKRFKEETKGLKSIDIDRETLRLIYKSADWGNTKQCLNYIYLDEKNIVATDTKRMTIGLNKSGVVDVFIPKSFAKLYCDDILSKLYIKELSSGETFVYLESIEGYNEFSYNKDEFGYVDYAKVVPKENKYKLTFDEVLERSMLFSDMEEKIDFLVIDTKDGFVFINREYVDFKLKPTIHFENHESAVVFENKLVKNVVMPYMVNKNEDIYKRALAWREVARRGTAKNN